MISVYLLRHIMCTRAGMAMYVMARGRCIFSFVAFDTCVAAVVVAVVKNAPVTADKYCLCVLL